MTCAAHTLGEKMVCVADLHVNVGFVGAKYGDSQQRLIYVWHDFQSTNIRGRSWFQPNGLPNTGDRRVPNAVWLMDLLSAGLTTGVGWVPQDDLLFPHLSVRENLAYAGAQPRAVSEVAELLSVEELLERRPRKLSGGERQRVALGRALLRDPTLLLLDEPFAALDRPLRAQLARTVERLTQRRQIPLVLVTHDEEDTRVLAEERWMLTDGVLRRA